MTATDMVLCVGEPAKRTIWYNWENRYKIKPGVKKTNRRDNRGEKN